MSDDLLKLLSELRKKNILLQLNGDNLKIQAPAGALNDELKAELKAHKAALIEFLQRSNTQESLAIVAVDRAGELPQSLAQERLWFLYQMQANASYNMAKAIKIRGPLRLDVLQKAFQALLERHESLRTRFASNAQGLPIQCIEQDLRLDMPVLDLSDLDPAQQAQEALTLALQEANTPFDLTQAPLIRVKVLRLADSAHIVLFTLHHIIADGWSLGVLVHDVLQNYAAIKAARLSPLPPLSLHYADFAVWQRTMMQAEDGRQQVRYWQKALAGVPDLLDLPTDHARPEQQSFRGAAHHFALSANQSVRLRQFAQQHDITLFMLLLAAFQLLLGRLSQQDDVSIGVPVAGRDQPETHALIGFFINALVLRGDMRGNPTVTEYLQRVRKTALEAFEHQNVPMEEVLKHLHIRRNAAFNPGAQVGFSWQSGLSAALPQEALHAVSELQIEAFEVPHSSTIQDLTLSLWEGPGGIEGRLEYATDLFEAATIELWVSSYQHLLHELVEKPAQSIHNLELLSSPALLKQLGLDAYDVESILPLTPMQRDIYLDASINPNTVQNSMAYSVVLSGQADIALLQQATEQLVAAEAMLRTEYRSIGSLLGDQVFQIVRSHGSNILTVLDWRTEKLSEEHLAQRLKKLLIHPYDINKDALFAHYLIVPDDHRFILAASSHHINSDGVGMSAHVRKWLARYQCLLGEEVTVPHSDYDFAQQLMQIRAQTDRLETISYWQEKFQSVEALVFPLPSLAVLHQEQEQRIVKQQAISEAHWKQLSAFCRRHRVVPALYFKMLYGYLLRHYCRATADFDIVEFAAGRSTTNLLDLAIHYEQQPFIFTLEALTGTNTFAELLAYGRDEQKQSREYRHLSISKKLRLMQPGPIIFTFNFLHFERTIEFSGQTLDVKLWPPVLDQSVQFIVAQNDAGGMLSLDYNNYHFRDHDFLARLLWLSEQVLANPDLRLSEFKLLSPFEQELQLNMNILAQRPLSDRRSVAPWFEQQVQLTPDALALQCGGSALSYWQLNQQANQLAHYLRSQGIGRNHLVAICLPRGLDMMVALLGTLKAGAAYLPLDPAYPEERLAFILKDSQSLALIALEQADEKMARVKAGFSGHTLLLDALHTTLAQQAKHNPEPVNDIDDLIYVIYTSGSTGQPKGSGVKHRGELNLLSWYVRESALDADARVMMMSAFGFDLTQKNLLAPLVSGAVLVLPEGELFDAPRMLEQLHSHGITQVNCAPSVFYPLLELGASNQYRDLRNLRQVVFGGEPIQMQRLLPWLLHANNRTQLVNHYGPTECTDIAASFRVRHPGDFKDKPIPIGRANDNVALYLVNEDNQLLPQGLIGELCISGQGVGSGYLNQATLNQQVFQSNPFAEEASLAPASHQSALQRWYRSGDLMRFLPDGNLEFISRKDFQVKVRGLRIEPGEIEWALRRADIVDTALVLAHEDKLLAFARKQSSCSMELARQWDWRAHLRKYLPDTMLPSQLCFVEQWPLTPNGKIDRKALPALMGESTNHYVAPRNPVEAALAEIWAQVLGLEKVGVEDNFFQIGGHSLLATRIISRCRQRFHVDLPLRELFESPTVATLALLIERARGQQQAPAITPAPADMRLPLSFAQQRLWFIDQLNPGNVAYLMPGAFRIKGALDIERLDQALKKLVERHSILRTHIKTEEGEGWQQVYEASEWRVEHRDLRKEKPDTEALTALIKHNSNTALDLAQDALFRVSLIRLTDDETLLLTCMHHIIGDGWSFAILLNELAHFYTPHAKALPPLPVQYGDYAWWQRQWMQGEVLERHIQFWQQHLRSAPAVLTLPTDRPRPSIQSFDGDNYAFSLPAILSEKVRRFAQDNQLTLFMVLLGAYKIQLARYSGQHDICVGLPVAGRAQAPTEQLIGLFLNAIVVRSRFEGNATLEQFYQNLKKNVLACFEHQELPAEILLEHLNIERSLSYPPVAQVGFQLQNFAELGELPAFADLQFESLPLGRVSSKYDMTFILKESAEGLSGVVEYSTLLFDPASISRFVAHYVHLLEAIVESKDQRVFDLQVLSSSQLASALGQTQAQQVQVLTHMQRDLVLLNRSNPDTLHNCFGGAVLFNEAVDAQRLHQALCYLARHSTVLRSRICLSKEAWLDVAYQVVFEDMQLDWELRDDLCFESKAQAEQYVKTFVFRPYDLNGNLLRFQLLQHRDSAYFLIAAHHALMDGMGVASLVASLLDVYHALQAQRESSLPAEFFPLYVHKERASTDTPEAIRYWREKLQNTAGLSQYRSNHLPLAQQSAVERCFLQLQDDHWQGVKHYCRAQRMTPALYFKGLFGLLIQLYCRPDNDFCLYELSSGLLNIRLNAAGCSVQRRPFVFERKHLQGEQTLVDYFHRLREEQSAIHKSGLHTSILTQKYLVPEGRVNFMYNYYHFTREFEVAGHAYETLLYPNDVEQVHLVVNFKQGQLELALHYPAGQFEPLHFLERLEALSQQIVRDQARHIKQLDYVLQSERTLLATVFTGKTKALDTLPVIATQCAQSLARHASRIALKQASNSLSYAQLNQAANHLALALKTQGVTHNSRVAVCLSRSPELMIALLAIIKTGAAYVPVDSAYPQERIRYIVSDSAASVLISHTALRDRLPDLARPCLWLDTLDVTSTVADVLPAVSSFDDLFYVIYTSGSTGQPKGASVTQRGVMNLLDWYIDEFDLQRVQKHLIISAFGFDLTQKNLWSALLTGGTLYFPHDDHYHPSHLLEQIRSEGIEIINCAPSALYGLVDACEGNFQALSSLRFVILGGEPIVLDRLRPWLSDAGCAAQIVNNYGPTECTDIAAFYRLEDIQRQSVPIGRPNTNVKLHLVNENGQAVPPGILGELCISGAGVGAGYLNKPELNSRAFEPIDEKHAPDLATGAATTQWYRSGDLMCLNREGELEFVGRKDFQVKLRGLRIELPEIEWALRALAGVEDCLVLVDRVLAEPSTNRAEQRERLIAYVIGPDSLNEMAWARHLALSLPAYMIPSQVIVLSQWPLTPNGKIDRSALPKPEEVNSIPFVAPRNDIEAQLAQIWCEVLGLSKLSVLDNFFAVGGNSLLAVRIIARMEKHFGHDFALSMLFSAQSIAELAQRVNHQINPHSWTPLVEIKAAQCSEGESAAPPLFFIHPVGGTVWCYQPLAEALHRLDSKRAIYGLQSSGLDAEQAILHNFETMAALYAEAIRAVQPQGPYFLLGQSMGGNIAWELAQQLQAQQQHVARVVLIDSFVPQRIPDFFRQQDTVSLLFHQFGQVLSLDWQAMRQQSLEQQIHTFYEAARAQGLISQDLGFEQVRRLALVMKANAEALLAYQARTYSGRVLHVRASDNTLGDASLGWAELVCGEWAQHSLPASHDGILQAPYAEALAAWLFPYLAYQNI